MNYLKVLNQQCIAVRKKEAEQLQNKMINMLDKDDDEIDLVFQAWCKRIKRNSNDEEMEDLMEELNATVTKHVRKARAKKNSCPQIDKVSTYMDRASSVPMVGQTNNVIPSTSATNPCGMPPMPALQRMNNFTYDRQLEFQEI